MKPKVDQNIVNALLELPDELVNFSGVKVKIREKKRNDESGIEHIALSRHGLKVKDIKEIPNIILKPNRYCKDRKRKNRVAYYGIRAGKKQNSFLKIIAKENKDKSQTIITIFTCKTIRNN